jgi:hypothetical protein
VERLRADREVSLTQRVTLRVRVSVVALTRSQSALTQSVEDDRPLLPTGRWTTGGHQGRKGLNINRGRAAGGERDVERGEGLGGREFRFSVASQ